MAATTTFNSASRIDYAEILDRRTKMIIMAGVLLGLFLSALDQTIVSTAMPRIVSDLNGINLLAWVSTAYLLTNTAMVPIYGKLSDIYGRKIVLISGIIIFLAASMLCGIASTMMQLVIFRGLQGLGGAALTSTAFAVPADIYAPAERAKLQGLTTAVFGLASVIGPYLGGLLTDNLSWHWVFFVNLPVGLIALSFIVLKMPKLNSGLRPKIDYLGAVFLLVTVVPFLLGLTLDKQQFGWTSPLILGLFALSAVGLAAFIAIERRAPSPILSFGLFRNKVFAIIIPVSILVGAAFFAAVLFLSLYLVNVLGVSATEAGTALIPLMGGLVFGSIVSSLLVQRIGRYKPLILGGLIMMALGFLWLLQLDLTTTLWTVRAQMIVLGLGLGMSMPILTLALQNAVGPAEIGAATAGRQFFQQLGQVVGSAVFGVILTGTLTTALTTNLAPITAKLPAEQAAQFDITKLRNGSGGGEGASGEQVDIHDRVATGIQERFASLRTLLEQAAGGDAAARGTLLNNPGTPPAIVAALQSNSLDAASLPQINAQLDQAEQAALAQGDELAGQIDSGVKRAFTSSITRIYLYALPMVLLGLALAFFIPE
ncbi:MAG TPA: MDR family MFS transporter, partial [Herpetosiphonaceae bacterium]|nr:MDR family MFS transporter [Herpetosiphonaceae bacterium]